MSGIDDHFTRNGVRKLLKLLSSSTKLGQHALAQLPPVVQLCIDNGYADSATGRGVALRDMLRSAIAALRPTGEPDYGDKRWRPFLILTEQYVNGRKPEYLAEMFGLVRGSFHQEQARSLELLGDRLREQFGGDAPGAPYIAARDADITEPEVRPPFLAPTRPPTPLVGREPLVAEIKALLFADTETHIAVYGLPGAGKTALAVEIANDRDVLDAFNEGVLWAGLGPQPDALGALGQWAVALGMSRDDIARQNTLDSRAQAVRGVIGFRRMLLVIDDVWELDVGEALKAGGPNCAYVFTTRQPALASALAGANVFHAPELGALDGAALLASHAPEIVSAHQTETAALIAAVGGLPLALTLMGRRLRQASIGNQHRRAARALAALTDAFAGHDGKALADVIASSEALLSAKARRALATLSIFPPKPGTFSEAAAVAAADCDIDVIDALFDSGLVEGVGDRLTLHQTIADHARQSLKQPDKPLHRALTHYAEAFAAATSDADALVADHGAALALIDQARNMLNSAGSADVTASAARCAIAIAPELILRGLLDAGEAALDPLLAAEANQKSTAFSPSIRSRLRTGRGRFAQRRGDFDRARRYFDDALALTQLDNPIATDEAGARMDALLALTTLANDQGERERADELGRQALAIAHARDDARALSAILTQLAAAAGFRAQFAESEAYLLEARQHARRAGDPRAEALLTLGLGLIDSWRGNVAKGDAAFAQSYTLARAAHARETASIARSMQGWVNANLGAYDLAIEQSRESLALIREGGFCESAGLAYTNLGLVALNRGALDDAQRYVDEGLRVVRRIGHKEGECMMANSLARLAAERGDYLEAERIAREGIQRCDDMNYWELMPSLMATLGESLNARGQYDDADGFLLTSLMLAQNMERPWLLAYGYTVWGGCYLDREEIDKAADAFAEAVRVSVELGAKPYQALALFGLARVAALRGDVVTARAQGGEALKLLSSIGHTRADKVRAWLAAMS